MPSVRDKLNGGKMKEKEAYCKNSPDFRIHGCILQNRKYGRREYAGEEKVRRDQVIQEYIYI